MSSALCPLSYDTVLDPAGRPLVGAKVYVYEAGTTQSATVYSDSLLQNPFQQPILTTGYGRVPAIYLPNGSFRVRLTDPLGAIMDDVDNVQGAVVTTENNYITQTGLGAPVGSLIPYYGTGAPTGWVRANGKSIGNAQSSGSERAQDDTEALFVALWNADPNLAVSGGRGNTADADFSAGKTINLPDTRRRVLAGLDGMGNGYLGSLANDPYRVLGTTLGEETHTLVVGEMPNHSHIMSCDTEGGHIHAASCDVQGFHSHSASSDVQGYHAHGASSDVQGYHAHGASSDVQGVHSHAATTDIQGGHQHTVQQLSYAADPSFAPGNTYAFDRQLSSPESTDIQGAHQHNITVQNAGQHQHNITIN